MILEKLNIINYRNLAQVDIQLSAGINCFVGSNGAGKTNLLDAIYYLSFCKSYTSVPDSLNIRHDEPFMVLQGGYKIAGVEEDIYCGVKRGRKKQFKRNKTDYVRNSDHIGLIPLVLVTPQDEDLIRDAAEARRKYMDGVISQTNPAYLDAYLRYNKLLQSRNALLKQFQQALDEGRQTDTSMLDVYDLQLAECGTVIAQKRREFIQMLKPVIEQIYHTISGGNEEVCINYVTALDRYDLYEGLRATHQRDIALGYTSRGVHKDDIEFLMAGHPIKQVGSQGQCKSFVIALKLAQYQYIEQVVHKKPLLLLDDVFAKLDEARGGNLIALVAETQFGQIFVSDTNRAQLMHLLERMNKPFAVFDVQNGEVKQA